MRIGLNTVTIVTCSAAMRPGTQRTKIGPWPYIDSFAVSKLRGGGVDG